MTETINVNKNQQGHCLTHRLKKCSVTVGLNKTNAREQMFCEISMSFMIQPLKNFKLTNELLENVESNFMSVLVLPCFCF
jgi:hypothetical protein